MSGIHRRRRPAPIEDAELQTGEAIFTTAGDPPAGPRCSRLDVSPREEDHTVKAAQTTRSRSLSFLIRGPRSKHTEAAALVTARYGSDQRQPAHRVELSWASAAIMPTPPARSPGP
jgi:hypothetical protein